MKGILMEKLSSKRGRVGEMELWRFLFAIIIVFHHSRNLIGNENAPFFNGAYAVEFFFILSGYLLMQSIAHSQDLPGDRLGTETIQFIKNKYLSFCPDLYISWIIGFLATVIITRCNVLELFMGGFWEMTLLHMGGLYISKINSAVWYLSSMLLGMLILYPLLRRYKETAKKLLVPLITLFLLGWFYQETGSLRVPFDWNGITFKANLRAIADLGLGVICYQTTQWFSSLSFNKPAKVMVALVKYFCYGTLITYMFTVDEVPPTQDFFFLILWMIAIGMTFSRQSIANHIFDNKWIFFLGKFSLPLYLSHYYWSNLLGELLPKSMAWGWKLAAYWAVSLSTAAIVMLLSSLWKKHRKTILLSLKKVFLKKED
ncbi:MAG: acyltransferase [Clostridia bacterium]|nr:acyltransferase [Clostridia bacterium]